ncbi:MAG: hypothetical protein LBH35_09310 [Treponema sp.]|jgi:hypothetical protein|nr:hypothetical protein [Treponema sp.]
MPFRPFFSALLFSVGSGILLSAAALMTLERAGSPWVVLEVPETVPGRELAETLQNAGIACVSDVSIPVLLNVFDGIREIPLDSYDDYVEAFDPRNDGYASALRSFFTAAGKRRFFLRPGFGLERKLAKLPPEFSGAWTLERFGVFPVAACAAFAAAALFFVLWETLSAAGTRPSPPDRRFSGGGEPGFPFGAFCAVPVLFPLALAGAPGLMAAGLFVVLFHASKPVLREYFRRYRKSFRSMKGNEGRELAGLYPLHRAVGLGIFPAYVLCCLVGGISPLIALPAPFFFCVSLFLSGKAEAAVDRNVFFPLPISGKVRPRALFPPALPVFLAAFALALSRPVSPPSPRSAPYGPLPGPEAYAAHAEFQASFSRRSLYGERSYGSYPVGEDGLISGFVPDPPAPLPSFPPYPPELEELARLFSGGND